MENLKEKVHYFENINYTRKKEEDYLNNIKIELEEEIMNFNIKLAYFQRKKCLIEDKKSFKFDLLNKSNENILNEINEVLIY